MPEIALWENPDLPAPFATIEREIEGRARQFALWHWENRIVWRDLKSPRLWWATLDVAASLADWKRAIDAGEFGRAFSQIHSYSGNGLRLNLPRRVRFKHTDYGRRCKFFVISNSFGRGVARQTGEGDWWPFPALDDKRPLKRVQQGAMKQPLWWPGLQIPHSGRAIWSGYATRFLRQLPPKFLRVLQDGEETQLLLIARSLFFWRSLEHPKEHNSTALYKTMPALPPRMGLPEETRLTITLQSWPFGRMELGVHCFLVVNGIEWSLSRFEAWPAPASSAHELLEFARRLKDSLHPILTPTEIAEILGA